MGEAQFTKSENEKEPVSIDLYEDYLSIIEDLSYREFLTLNTLNFYEEKHPEADIDDYFGIDHLSHLSFFLKRKWGRLLYPAGKTAPKGKVTHQAALSMMSDIKKATLAK